MVEAIIAIIMALVSYFGSKKAGASDGEAALIAAGAGLGTYYVSTQTEWGKGIVDKIENWVGITDDDGQPVLEADGTAAKVPEGAEVLKNPDGTPKRDANGNIMWKLVDAAGNVLTSWGPTGTAAVIGAGAAASVVDDYPWLIPAGIGLAAFAILS